MFGSYGMKKNMHLFIGKNLLLRFDFLVLYCHLAQEQMAIFILKFNLYV
jgi:hypothetical protein